MPQKSNTEGWDEEHKMSPNPGDSDQEREMSDDEEDLDEDDEEFDESDEEDTEEEPDEE